MGVNLKDLIVKKQIELKDLAGKKIAIDAYNFLYQFLAAIRQRDGTPLMDSEGNITSHLSGLFYRTLNLMEHGIKPVFVFDGEAPSLKAATQMQRREVRAAALKKYKAAKKAGDIESARKYAQQALHLTPDMVSESKQLLKAMGLPWVQAVTDGEAQASYMCRQNMVWGVASQDYDALLFGTPRLIRNLNISGKKKVHNKSVYVETKIEMIDLSETLGTMNIDLTDFVNLALLIGTDYNTGVKGVGPKTALKIIQQEKFEEYSEKIPRLNQVQNIFLKPPVTTGFSLKWQDPDENKLKELLTIHDFSEKRIENALKRLAKKKDENKQTDLSKFG